MPLPDPDRLAHHEAGHAVIQHRVSKGRFHVTRVSLETRGDQVAGSSLIDREIDLGLYEFGLVVLAGIAAENRYFREHPPDREDMWGAVGDIEEWMAAAREALGSEARVEMVTANLMKRLRELFEDQATWGAVSELAGLLLMEGAVAGERLQAILERGNS